MSEEQVDLVKAKQAMAVLKRYGEWKISMLGSNTTEMSDRYFVWKTLADQYFSAWGTK